LSKHSFEKEYLRDVNEPIDPLDDLNNDEQEALKEWEQFFESKYVHHNFIPIDTALWVNS
jgi:hypothetical protein